ncbi:hypothetical protein UO65_2689 [Actinokineospora spheciospongiae]|uniref:DnaJ homologue subfamily C member 28 conserved domain-containing protein n=1 Tax=Actinokineospora spheciospongiae TaxID=909613 RepID=W7INK6_9PSEU|nr:DUF1992 domain-containing protein [Actinokineospora spheciospongiae]EWC61978.1 hypothetical protein UO65_2689 [Actinokineospora spheciospongiae]PWW63525.1 uncharacterized protein DUF1992 [Actinokineospora spheciospongiae]
MTERKPAGVGFESWVESQISEARNRGDFDNLPGAGKPLPRGGDWLSGYLRREGVETREVLPPQLRLRREVELIPERVGALRSEAEVRAVVRDVNGRIDEWMRTGSGPVLVRFVDEDEVVAGWVASRPVEPPVVAPVVEAGGVSRRSWWRRWSST